MVGGQTQTQLLCKHSAMPHLIFTPWVPRGRSGQPEPSSSEHTAPGLSALPVAPTWTEITSLEFGVCGSDFCCDTGQSRSSRPCLPPMGQAPTLGLGLARHP